jgi:hypothetical protein
MASLGYFGLKSGMGGRARILSCNENDTCGCGVG